MASELQRVEWLLSEERHDRDLKVVQLIKPIADTVLNATSEILQLEGVGDVFPQQRVGKDGVVFDMHKLRTMTGHDHADSSIGEKLATKTGTLARLLRIDEFAQLQNILDGEMGFVGVRPLIPGDILKMQAALPPHVFERWWQAYIAAYGGVIGHFALVANALIESGRIENQSLQYFELRAMLDTGYVFDKASKRFDNHLIRRASLRTVDRVGHVMTRRLGEHDLVTDLRTRSRKLLDYFDAAA
ncbi:sugar transferase [Candidatus Saccharibacteria bacterium]|nr:sugar transferase [Candidatus Saccharibacteria bacterium]